MRMERDEMRVNVVSWRLLMDRRIVGIGGYCVVKGGWCGVVRI